MRGRERRQTPAQLADRRARAAQDHGSRHTAESINVRRDARHSDHGRTARHERRHDRRRRLRGRGDRPRSRRRAAGAGRLRRGQARAAQARGDARRGQALHRRRAGRALGRSIPSGRGSPRPTVVSRAKELGTKTLCWEVPHHVSDAHVGALVEGTLLAAYSYREFKSQATTTAAACERPAALGPPRRERRPPRRPPPSPPRSTAPATCRTGPANVLTPTALAERAPGARGRARRGLDGAAIEAAGMGAFACVAQGSYEDARLITLRYEPADVTGPLLGLRRQGRDLRHRRDLDQARGEDARDEVRHVRRRGGDRGRRRRSRRSGCRSASRAWSARPRTCRPGARSSRATSCAPSRA